MNTLKDLLDACGKRTDWFQPNVCEWTLKSDEFVFCDGKKITLNSPLKMTYYYYDHMVDEFRKDDTRAGFLTKDYGRFIAMMKLANQLKNETGLSFMPNKAYVDIILDGKTYFFGEVYIGNEEIFMLIDHAEHECG